MGRRPVSTGGKKPSVDLTTPVKENPLSGLLGAYTDDEDSAATPKSDAKVDNFLAEIDNIVGGKTEAKDTTTEAPVGPWQKVWDASHKAHYYWHSGNNEVTWTEPVDFGKPEVKAPPVPVGGDSTKERRKKPSRFGQAPPDVADEGEAKPDASTTENKGKRSRSPSPQKSKETEPKSKEPKSKAAKVESSTKGEGGKNERANRVREIMLKLGMGKDGEDKEQNSKDKDDDSKPSSSESGKPPPKESTDDAEEALIRAEIPGLVAEVKEELAALSGSKAVGFDPMNIFAESGDKGGHTVQDALLVVNTRLHDWKQSDSGMKSKYFASILREMISRVQKLKASTKSKSVVAAAPAVRKAKKPSSIEKALPPANGTPDPLIWLIYLDPASSAAQWNPEQVAGHFSSLRGLSAVRTIGQGFYGLEFAKSSPANVLVQLTTSSMTVPSSPLEWRMLSDRVVYARQASASDNVVLYPATYSLLTDEPEAAVAAEQPNEVASGPKVKLTSKIAVPAKKGSAKKLNPMIGKWQAARAEIEDYEKRNKKESEMSLEELNERKGDELKQWRKSQSRSKPLPNDPSCPLCLWREWLALPAVGTAQLVV